MAAIHTITSFGCPRPAFERSTGLLPAAPALALHEALQLLAAGRVAELAQGLGLDLTDALAGDVELLPHLLQGVVAAVADPEAEAQDSLLARRQRLQDLFRLSLQIDPDHCLQG